MTCSIKARKKKGISIVALCIFVYILIIADYFNAVQFATSYLPCDILFYEENWGKNSQVWCEDKRHYGDTNASSIIVIPLAKVTVSNTSKTKLGILIPSTTRHVKNPLLEKLSLTTICLPSIYKTMQIEYAYTIYVGIDQGDYLETVKDKLEKMFDRVKIIVTTGGSFTKTVNAIARKSYQDGMDYLVRINDDTAFVTKNWTSEGLDALRNYSPPDIGVVGPTCPDRNPAILTHDMVHRTHLEIFDFYYPPYFDNWWADDWITKVYKPGRSLKLHSWVVRHKFTFHGTRYHVDFKKEVRLNKLLCFDRQRLAEHLSNLKFGICVW